MSESNQDLAGIVKTKRGGKRLGAGRKPSSRVTARLTITLPAALVAWLLGEKGTPSQIIEKLLYYEKGRDEK